jgi:hypothetical protein
MPAILLLPTKRRKIMISKMLAETIETTMKKGIEIVNQDVGGLNKAIQNNAKGTGTKVAIVIRALDVNNL